MLTIGTGRGSTDHFTLIYTIFIFFIPLYVRRPDILSSNTDVLKGRYGIYIKILMGCKLLYELNNPKGYKTFGIRKKNSP